MHVFALFWKKIMKKDKTLFSFLHVFVNYLFTFIDVVTFLM